MPKHARFAGLLLVVALTTEAAAQPPNQPSAPEEVLERFPIQKGALLTVPVELQGKTYLFALDTGASRTVCDSSLAPLLGEPLGTEEILTALGTAAVPRYPPPGIRLGKLSLRKGDYVYATDLRRVREVSDTEVFGLLGMDVLRDHIFRVDPDRGEVVFLRSAGPDAGRRLPVTIGDASGPQSVGGIPYVEADVAGMVWPERFQIDTGMIGFGSGDLRPEAYDVLVRLGQIKPVRNSLGLDLRGTAEKTPRGTITAVAVAGNRHTDLVFDKGTRNALGLSYWSRYAATFDFPGGGIYLKPSRGFDQPDRFNLSGLALQRVDGQMTVFAVFEETPAARAGIQAQDVILEIDGEKAETVRLNELEPALAEPGRTLRFLLARGGRTWEVSLKFAD
jgi:hypothetical protein